ncbi:MAG: TPM domain-containing protein [Holophagales bacterium]|nr:TPM domain-containing protein [Holophagales bacterium]
MLRRQLRQRIDEEAVKAAIVEAERGTTGEIRVSLSTFFWGDVRKTAERSFERLGMTATARRNGVLFFLVPSRRKFAVLGDAGIHEKVGQGFWDAITAAVEGRFRKGDFTGGLVLGIAEAGRVLALHFPREDANPNELSDDVDFGE